MIKYCLNMYTVNTLNKIKLLSFLNGVLCQYNLRIFGLGSFKLQNKYVKHNCCQHQNVMENLAKPGK